MQQNLLIILCLLFAVSMFTILSEKWKISYPIFLVLAGLLISFIPHVPQIRLNPNIVFLFFLPPLLFFAAWNTSWKNFWAYRAPIGMLAIGMVIITSCAVALLAHLVIPGFPLALGFLLGAIISPPDAIAATSVLHGLKVSKKAISILEGESLVNDASSLIVFRFALAALLTGQFSFWKATGEFFAVAGMGIAIGLAIAGVIYVIYRFLPTTADVDTVITLLTPYIIYLTAEYFHFSGVMAVVSGGLLLSARSHKVFNYNSRLQVNDVWKTVNFLLNGFVFILIGLQLFDIMHGLKQYSLRQAIGYTVLISVLTILIRIIWVFPSAYFPYLFKKPGQQHRNKFPRKSVFLIAWSGMRGVVSLASALSVPLLLSDGNPFPNRNLILFITFGVILFTLVLQGLSIPWIIRKLNMPDRDEKTNAESEEKVRLRLATSVLEYIAENYSEEVESKPSFRLLKERYELLKDLAENNLQYQPDEYEGRAVFAKYNQLLIELVEVRRKELHKLREERLYTDEMLNARERELDLEEARLFAS